MLVACSVIAEITREVPLSTVHQEMPRQAALGIRAVPAVLTLKGLLSSVYQLMLL